MKIITITKTKENGGYLANVHQTSNTPLQGFAETEVGALEMLLDKIKERSDKFIQITPNT